MSGVLLKVVLRAATLCLRRILTEAIQDVGEPTHAVQLGPLHQLEEQRRCNEGVGLWAAHNDDCWNSLQRTHGEGDGTPSGHTTHFLGVAELGGGGLLCG